jgi:beta-lactamase superfamily II metal-dependent hydrolase
MILFDVSHGFCCFVKSPNGYLVLADCGNKEFFSPIEYILANEVRDSVPFNGYPLTQFIVTHPHDDHISDISRLKAKFRPDIIVGWKYAWEEVKTVPDGDYRNLDAYSNLREQYSAKVTQYPNWGMEVITEHSLTPDRAKTLEPAKFVNNSSIPVLLKYLSWKILIGGDLETAAWEELLKPDAFRQAVRGVGIFVPSHHGHASGYSKALYDAMGKPFINLISITSRDENIDAGYSSPDRAKGIQFNGQTRYMLSTRKDGSLIFQIFPDGRATIDGIALPDNLRRA